VAPDALDGGAAVVNVVGGDLIERLGEHEIARQGERSPILPPIPIEQASSVVALSLSANRTPNSSRSLILPVAFRPGGHIRDIERPPDLEALENGKDLVV